MGPSWVQPKKRTWDHPPVDLPSTGGRQKGDCSVCLVAVNGINRGRQIPGKPMVCSLQLQVGERVLTVICSYALNNSACPCWNPWVACLRVLHLGTLSSTGRLQHSCGKLHWDLEGFDWEQWPAWPEPEWCTVTYFDSILRETADIKSEWTILSTSIAETAALSSGCKVVGACSGGNPQNNWWAPEVKGAIRQRKESCWAVQLSLKWQK